MMKSRLGPRRESPMLRRWVGEQNFKGERHRVVLLPDAQGGLSAALGGLGKRQGSISLWHAAGIAERLPPRRYVLRNPSAPPRRPRSRWDSLMPRIASSAIERVKPEHCAGIEPPRNADLVYVEAAAKRSRWRAIGSIRRPEISGPAELAAAARRLAERHAAQL